MVEVTLLFLLLPVAAFTGWYVGSQSKNRADNQSLVAADTSQYFQGLNYLIHDSPDQAIEVFISMAELDSETVEIHLALGSLFRRRGEVDRAIRIHQNIIARPSLTQKQKEEALFELGTDYLKAGLLDRAENIQVELKKSSFYRDRALRQLLLIYQNEKDWERAIDIATELKNSEHQPGYYSDLLAQFYCELSVDALEKSDIEGSIRNAQRALDSAPQNIRALVVNGNAEFAKERYKKALSYYGQVLALRPDFINEIGSRLYRCFTETGDIERYRKLLESILEDGSVTDDVVLEYVEILEQVDFNHALGFMQTWLQENTSIPVLARYIGVISHTHTLSNSLDESLNLIRQVLLRDQKERISYRCQQCGFGSVHHYWRCPSCHTWDQFAAC